MAVPATFPGTTLPFRPDTAAGFSLSHAEMPMPIGPVTSFPSSTWAPPPDLPIGLQATEATGPAARLEGPSSTSARLKNRPRRPSDRIGNSILIGERKAAVKIRPICDHLM